MRKRFQNILRKTGKKNGILMLAISCTVGFGMLAGCSAADESAPGVQKQPRTESEQPDDRTAETVCSEPEGSDTDILDIVLGEPGDDTFTHDLEHQLALGQLPQPTLTYSLEGEVHEVPAVIVQGNGYTLYLPDGDWYPSDFENWADVDEEWKARIFDAWTAWNNEDVRLWTARLEGISLDEVQKELQDNGYAVIGDRMLRQDGDRIYSAELKEAETDTWGIFASYPVDAQEGWGVQIHAIADTFTASETGNF